MGLFCTRAPELLPLVGSPAKPVNRQQTHLGQPSGEGLNPLQRFSFLQAHRTSAWTADGCILFGHPKTVDHP